MGITALSASRSPLCCEADLVAGRVIENLADLGRRRLAARHLDRDEDLAGDHHGGGEDAVADSLLGRSGLAGQGMLVDHRHPLDDVAVDRDDLAGMHDNDVTLWSCRAGTWTSTPSR